MICSLRNSFQNTQVCVNIDLTKKAVCKYQLITSLLRANRCKIITQKFNNIFCVLSSVESFQANGVIKKKQSSVENINLSH